MLSEQQIDESGPLPLPKLLRVGAAAHELAVSPRTVWRLIGLGELETVRIGRSVRVTLRSIEAFISKGGSSK